MIRLSKKNKVKLLISLLFIMVICIILFLPIKIPYSIITPGKVIPSKEWIILKGADGRVITLLKNNVKGSTETYTVSQFERGDAIHFELMPEIGIGSFISENDTVAKIYSNEIERQYVQLKGELEVTLASLELNKAGEKSSVIEEEKKQLEYKKKQAEEYQKQYLRIKALFDKEMVSQEEYEIAKSNNELYDLNVKISEAHIQSISTGSKPEQIKYINSQISSLQKQIDALRARFENYILVSKVSGSVNQIYSGDTILVVSDTSKLLVISPVKWIDRNFIQPNQIVTIKTPDSEIINNALVYRKEKQAQLLNRQQVFLISSRLENISADLVPGLFVECSVQCNPVSPIQYLSRLLKTVM